MDTTPFTDCIVVSACRAIERSDPAPSLATLAQDAGLSASQLHRRFKATLGLSPKAYAKACQARRAELKLAVRSSITHAIHDAGFGSTSRFYATSQLRLGMEPRRWKNGGRGEQIVFALGQSALGALLVAATDRGLCAIWLDDDPDRLLARLEEQFHGANLCPGSEHFHRLVAEVSGLIEQASTTIGYPLDIRGTVFQEQVWRTLSCVPAGQTVSYADLARLAGVPGAVRAVASACAKNQLAYVIPCHRVVRTSGELGGYRWGVERKALLLDRENHNRAT